MNFSRSTRREALGALAMTFGIMGSSAGRAANDEADPLNEAAVLRDPALPVGGNPNGDISLIEWSDYNCPYCRKLAPELRKLVTDDGKLRIIHKDWPILGPDSIVAAKLALATRFQDKYLVAQQALIAGKGRITEATAKERLRAAGIDVDRATKDVTLRAGDIAAVLKRNNAQAEAFGFDATPSFIIGKFRVPGAMSIENFKLAIADARKALRDESRPDKAGQSEKI